MNKKNIILWPCVLWGSIHTADGKLHSVCRVFEGMGDVKSAALAELAKRRDRGAPWYGDAVQVTTPLGEGMTVDVPWTYRGHAWSECLRL